jgi:hypothetical protein
LKSKIKHLRSIGKSSLVSNVLCSNHNSALSPLDTTIGNFVNAIGNIDAEFLKDNPIQLSYNIDGANIERWILKTAFGLVKSGQIMLENKKQFVLKNKCVDLLCSPKTRWPLGWGLYVSLSVGEIYHSSSFELIPICNVETGELLALGLKFNGIEMNFIMGRPDQAHAFGILRPSTLVFQKGSVVSNIIMNWSDRKVGSPVIFSRTGDYSGPPPDHPIIDVRQ